MCSFLCERDTVAAPYLCLLSSYSTSMLRLSSAQKITFGSDSAARRHLLAVPLPQSPGQTSESRKPTWVLLKKTKQTKMLSWYFAPPSSVGGTTCPLNLNQPKKKNKTNKHAQRKRRVRTTTYCTWSPVFLRAPSLQIPKYWLSIQPVARWCHIHCQWWCHIHPPLPKSSWHEAHTPHYYPLRLLAKLKAEDGLNLTHYKQVVERGERCWF